MELTNGSLSSSGLQYLVSLLQPYVDEINKAETVDQIRDWLPKVFGAQWYQNFIKDHKVLLMNNNVQVAKGAITKYFLDSIIEEMNIHLLNYTTKYLFPWDVRALLLDSREYNVVKLFGLSPFTNTIPVTIMINGQSQNYELSQDFIIGLLTVGDFEIYINGVLLSDEDKNYLISQYKIADDKAPHYSARLNGQLTHFQTKDFLRGYMSGLSWRGLNYNEYVKDPKMVIYRKGIGYLYNPVQI